MKKWIIPVLLLGLLCVGCTETTDTTIGTVAEYEDTVAEIKGAEFFADDNGDSMIRVRFDYTNNGADGMYMYESFSVRAFQNDIELLEKTDINDDTDSSKLIQEVKNGKTISGSYVFQLQNNTDVEVIVYSPTADEILLAKQMFNVEPSIIQNKAEVTGDKNEAPDLELSQERTDEKEQDILPNGLTRNLYKIDDKIVVLYKNETGHDICINSSYSIIHDNVEELRGGCYMNCLLDGDYNCYIIKSEISIDDCILYDQFDTPADDICESKRSIQYSTQQNEEGVQISFLNSEGSISLSGYVCFVDDLGNVVSYAPFGGGSSENAIDFEINNQDVKFADVIVCYETRI